MFFSSLLLPGAAAQTRLAQLESALQQAEGSAVQERALSAQLSGHVKELEAEKAARAMQSLDSEMRSRLEIEAALRARFEQVIVQTEQIMNEKYSELLNAFQSRLLEQRRATEAQRAEDLQHAIDDRLVRDGEREGQMKQFEAELTRRYEALVAEQAKRLEQARLQGQQVLMRTWTPYF
ncbi:hypothetical protein PAPYR_11346 [Paratrimastix pyriformis]|uniref:Uncharacterized protein n=1 Tax=Paratrimastix pyriformis TaxID=342808 RepID=A0ABQ8U3Y0_9EUKA|nr:hypothetical protein PAPYR_11346 [Paratrimastix pyriformis]